MKKHSLQVGVNLGGWISQYREFDYAHFDTFIQENDIQQIASWGMDHVRLPVDYPVIESTEKPGTINERGIVYIERCLEWCERVGLRLVLDLHKAPGYTFTNTLEAGQMKPNTLFSDREMQRRFISIWEAVTHRFASQLDNTLAFELLNEIVLPDSRPWNMLAQKTIDHIRRIDQNRLIIIGGNNYNAVEELKNIEILSEKNILHTFHFYHPMVVTHQRASWVNEMDLFGQEVEYPGRIKEFGKFLDQHAKYKPKYKRFIDFYMDQDYLHEALQPAFDFITKTGNPVYCGEFGVIDHAPLQTRINWTHDFIDLLTEHKIGRAIWSYKEMNFALVDAVSNVISDELVKVVTKR